MNKLGLILIVCLGLSVPVFFAFAITGTIDSTHKYAWSNNAGWINFGCDHCHIQVTNTAITGYAWSENYGWINFSPTGGGGVSNTTGGVLSGSAWGENTGWIDFSGVTINSSGQFTEKTVSNDIVGQINFSCTPSTGCPVTTDWRPTSPTSCGDGICNGVEACETCPGDCGCGDGGGNHTECSAQECISVSGPGINECVPNLDQCVIICSADTECGTNGYSLPFCQNGNVYQHAYTCNNPGETSSSCTESTTAILKTICLASQMCYGGACTAKAACSADTDCGNNGFDAPFCQNGNVYQYPYTCSSPGSPSSSCVESATPQKKTTCTDKQTCANGACVALPITCSTKTDCGIDGFDGAPFCQDGNVYQYAYACINPGELNSSCSTPVPQLQTTCSIGQACSAGSCVNQNRQHNECNGSQCALVDGVGINQCTGDTDCQNPIHNACNIQKQCVPTSGAGNDLCQTSGDCGGGGTGGTSVTHAECNTEEKCISVDGAGENKCDVNNANDCKKSVPAKIVDTIATTITNIVDQQIPETVKVVVQQTKKIIETPQGSTITKTVSTTGFVVAIVATTAPLFSFSFFEIFLLPFRLFGLLLIALGLRKRILPWGVVYDSVTKQPLDPAYVVLKNVRGDIVSSAVTDLDGRYGFLVGPGIYQMQANKTNYVFPSQKLSGKTYDELHTNLYFGENIEVKASGDVITKNIPLDAVKFDWNEFAKKNKNLMKFYSKWDGLLRKIYDWFFGAGFVVAIIAYVFAPYPYNTVIMIFYLLLLLLRAFGLRPKAYGYITDKITGDPLSFAIIRVVLPDSNAEITSKSADKYGKYYCLVPPGKYYVKIERKNADESYSLVHTSDAIDVSHKGIIKQNFKV